MIDSILRCVPARWRGAVRAAADAACRAAFVAGQLAERARVLEILTDCANGPKGYACGHCDPCAQRRNIESGESPSPHWRPDRALVPGLDDGAAMAPC